jgi:hypothetical protein
MVRMFFHQLLLSSALLPGVWSFSAISQVVNDTAFCLAIDKSSGSPECKPIPDGSDVKMSALPTLNGYKTIYFWADLEGDKDSAVSFYFGLQGSCYDDDVKLRDNPSVNPSLLRTILAEGSVILASAARAMEVDIGLDGNKPKGDIKILPTKIVDRPHNKRYDFRYVQCGGIVKARLLDSEGRAIPPSGKNNLKTLNIVE